MWNASSSVYYRSSDRVSCNARSHEDYKNSKIAINRNETTKLAKCISRPAKQQLFCESLFSFRFVALSLSRSVYFASGAMAASHLCFCFARRGETFRSCGDTCHSVAIKPNFTSSNAMQNSHGIRRKENPQTSVNLCRCYVIVESEKRPIHAFTLHE